MYQDDYAFLLHNLGLRINQQMQHHNLDQNELAKISKQSQATISNIVNGKPNVSLKTLFVVMESLNMDPLSEVNFCSKREGPTPLAPKELDNLRINIPHTLICNPSDIVFQGQTGHYYVYFHSTNRHDSLLLHGDLTLYEEDNHCKAKMQINTCSDDSPTKKDSFKTYNGIVFISPLQQAVYIIFTNASIGEMSFITFPYRQILTPNRQLKCTLALALTISAGIDSRTPTTHRVFLSRKLLPASDEKKIHSQLLLNKSLIRISEQQFKNMINENIIHSDFINFFEKHSTEQKYYEIDEDMFKTLIRKDSSFFTDLCYLRQYSTAPKNNKINERIANYIYRYIIE